jgi:hypothetical protein
LLPAPREVHFAGETVGARSAGRDAIAPQNRARAGFALEFFRKQQVLKSGKSDVSLELVVVLTRQGNGNEHFEEGRQTCEDKRDEPEFSNSPCGTDWLWICR